MPIQLAQDWTAEVKELFLNQVGALAIFDREGKYVYVNDRWQEHLGIPADSVLGKAVRDIIPNSLVYDVLQSGQGISGVSIWPRSKEEAFRTANYVPLYRGSELVGCAMYTIFNTAKQAEDFYRSIQQTQGELNYYKNELQRIQGAKYSLDNIIGNSPQIKKMRQEILSAARTNSNVLIEGETGSGKELVAHSIHTLSARTENPFVKVNCAAIPPELAESELFGYEGGAFTGAKRSGKPGKFELAHRGSLFLDEINQLSLPIQPKLLRVLQEHEVEHVGGQSSIPVNVRIIAATNVPLMQMVQDNRFRQDLYYRLDVVRIQVPPLRKRREDIPLLAQSIIQELNRELGTSVEGISDEACQMLQQYDWPGNVRELRNVLERSMNGKGVGFLQPENIKFYTRYQEADDGIGLVFSETDFRTAKAAFEAQYFQDVLHRCNGNKQLAAKSAGLSRAMLYRKLELYNISL